jgi:hypothetical protein
MRWKDCIDLLDWRVCTVLCIIIFLYTSFILCVLNEWIYWMNEWIQFQKKARKKDCFRWSSKENVRQMKKALYKGYFLGLLRAFEKEAQIDIMLECVCRRTPNAQKIYTVQYVEIILPTTATVQYCTVVIVLYSNRMSKNIFGHLQLKVMCVLQYLFHLSFTYRQRTKEGYCTL